MKTNYIKAIIMFVILAAKITPTIIKITKEIWEEVTKAANKDNIKKLDEEIKRNLEVGNE